MRDKDPIYDEPSDVRAVDGSVKLDGPDAVDVTVTAEAAEEISDRLLLIKPQGPRTAAPETLSPSA